MGEIGKTKIKDTTLKKWRGPNGASLPVALGGFGRDVTAKERKYPCDDYKPPDPHPERPPSALGIPYGDVT